MFSPRGAALLFMALGLPACVTSQDSRTEDNREQLDRFLEFQAKQTLIEEYARSNPAVDSVTAYLREDSVIVKMFLKKDRRMSARERDDLNGFITRLTGVPVDRITLAVPESSYPELRSDE